VRRGAPVGGGGAWSLSQLNQGDGKLIAEIAADLSKVEVISDEDMKSIHEELTRRLIASPVSPNAGEAQGRSEAMDAKYDVSLFNIIQNPPLETKHLIEKKTAFSEAGNFEMADRIDEVIRFSTDWVDTARLLLLLKEEDGTIPQDDLATLRQKAEKLPQPKQPGTNEEAVPPEAPSYSDKSGAAGPGPSTDLDKLAKEVRSMFRELDASVNKMPSDDYLQGVALSACEDLRNKAAAHMVRIEELLTKLKV